MSRFIKSEEGVLTFEWILLITILVIGVIVGLAAVRDSLSVELSDISQAAGSVNQSYNYYGIETKVIEGTGATGFISYHNTNGAELFDMPVVVTIEPNQPAAAGGGRNLADTNGI